MFVKQKGGSLLALPGWACLVGGQRYGLPLFYRKYEGNCHDSKVFEYVLEDILDAMRKNGRHEVTAVVDKGMNSEECVAVIDAMDNVHFVTSYSTYLADELVHFDKE